MLRREKMKKFVKANYIFKTEHLVATNAILCEIAEWANETNTEVVYYCSSLFNNDKSVSFAFESEEDMGMFALRWYDILEQCYQNSSWKRMMLAREQVLANYKTIKVLEEYEKNRQT